MPDVPPPLPGRPNPHVALAMKLGVPPSTPHDVLLHLAETPRGGLFDLLDEDDEVETR